MHPWRNRTAWLQALVLLAAPLQARPPLPAEAEAHARIMATLLKALPALPQDWEPLQPEGGFAPLSSVSTGQERFVMRFDLERSWRNPGAIAAQERVRQEELEAMKPFVQEDIRQFEAFQAKRMAILKPRMEALGRGDPAAWAADPKELDRLEAQDEPRRRAMEARWKESARRASLRDGAFSVHVAINESGTGLAQARPDASPTSGALAFRSPGSEDAQGAWSEGTTTVLLGPWKASKGQGMDAVELRAPLSRRAGYLRPQTLLLSVQGEEARVRRFLQAVDWPLLRSLLAPWRGDQGGGAPSPGGRPRRAVEAMPRATAYQLAIPPVPLFSIFMLNAENGDAPHRTPGAPHPAILLGDGDPGRNFAGGLAGEGIPARRGHRGGPG